MTIRKNKRHTRLSGRTTRSKRTFSLSASSLAYLDGLAKQHRSVSEALDALIRERQEAAERERISAGIRNYYNSLGEQEREEKRAWGEFVHAHLSSE